MKAERAADRLWALVPGWTRFRDERDGEGVLRAIVEAAGAGLDEVRKDVLRLLDDLFVETCDERLVPLVGDLVGVHVDPDIPVARQRHQVKYALHLRRRKGTVAELQTLGWQITGFRTQVHEPPSAQRTVHDPPLSARVSGAPPALVRATAANVSGRIHAGNLEVVMDVAWPVRRAQVELVPVGPDVHAVHPTRDVGLRCADGTPIFRSDDPAKLVGPGRPIEVALLGADFSLLGRLRPWFTSLPSGVRAYVPDHAIAIDPERGRVAGPTGPAPVLRAFRRYRLHFWQPLRGEIVSCAPAHQGDGVFTFAPDSELTGLTDAEGHLLRVAFEGEGDVCPDPGEPGKRLPERLLIVREPGHRRIGEPAAPFVLLPPGVPLPPGKKRWDSFPDPKRGDLPLDVAGLNRLFSIEDEWGWDRFRDVRLVAELGREPPPDGTVEINVERGIFRVSPAHEGADLRVRYHRLYDVTAIKRRGEDALRGALPLGRRATLRFRDTAPGSTEVCSL